MDFSGDCYYYGDTCGADCDTYIDADAVQKRIEYKQRPDYQPFVMPTFEAVRKACNKAARIAHKHDDILTAAAKKAETLVSENSCGLSVVRCAMQGQKDIEYRR